MNKLNANSNNRQIILDVASKIMMDKGVKDTSLAEIAKTVNISKGTLYYYYPSKSDLVYDITEQHFDLITKNLLHWIEQKREELSIEELLNYVYETLLNAETRSKLHLYLLQDALLNNQALMKRFQEKYQEWRILIENELKKIYKGNKEKSRVLSFIILATIDGFLIQRNFAKEKIPLDEVIMYLK